MLEVLNPLCYHYYRDYFVVDLLNVDGLMEAGGGGVGGEFTERSSGVWGPPKFTERSSVVRYDDISCTILMHKG